MNSKGQTTMEAILLMVAVFVTVTIMMDFLGPKLRTTLLLPLKNEMEDSIRFGIAKSEGQINPLKPEENLEHPFHGNRNRPIHQIGP